MPDRRAVTASVLAALWLWHGCSVACAQPPAEAPSPEEVEPSQSPPSVAPGLLGELARLLSGGTAGTAAAAQPVLPPAATGPGSPVAARVTQEDVDRIRASMGVDPFERIDLHVRDEDLATVLRLLSVETERNIVIGPDVTARITADFYRVGFYEALEAMLGPNGLAYEERGGFIFVQSAAALAERAAAGTRRIAEVIELRYLNAFDARVLATPLLSEGGSITSPAPPPEFAIPDDAPIGRDDYASSALVVVHDLPERVEAIRELLARLDEPPQQVLIEATILQATIDEANAWGVDFSVLADLEFGEVMSPLGAFSGLLDGAVSGEGTAVTSGVGGTGAPGGIKLGVLTDSVAVFVRALDEVTDVTMISRPKLLTLNRQAARVLVGTRVGFLNSTTATQTTTVQEVDFLNTGTQLNVRPFILDGGQIRLELRPQVSSATLRTTASPGGGSLTIPDEDTTELVTNLIVADGQTVVLGGLFTEMTTSTRRQAPVVGDIPVLGAAFRGNDDAVTRSEIIFLIRPTILDPVTASRQGIEGERATEQARLGARRGLLPWSREKRVGQLLIDAERLRRAGDASGALLRVERALGLAPASLEAARLRDRLIGDAEVWPEQSVLESIMRGHP